MPLHCTPAPPTFPLFALSLGEVDPTRSASNAGMGTHLTHFPDRLNAVFCSLARLCSRTAGVSVISTQHLHFCASLLRLSTLALFHADVCSLSSFGSALPPYTAPLHPVFRFDSEHCLHLCSIMPCPVLRPALKHYPRTTQQGRMHRLGDSKNRRRVFVLLAKSNCAVFQGRGWKCGCFKRGCLKLEHLVIALGAVLYAVYAVCIVHHSAQLSCRLEATSHRET